MKIEPFITYWPNLTDTQGSEWHAPDWETVLDRLSKPREYQGDQQHPGWSPVRFSPCERSDENAREIYALCLDFDGGVTIEAAAEHFAPLLGLITTTRKHTPDMPRLRVVLPLKRAASVFEYQEMWKRYAASVRRLGALDTSTRNPSRFWFLPGSKSKGEFRAERLAGTELLDVDEWLAKPDPTVARIVQRRPVDSNSDQSKVIDRAVKYISRMPESIAGARGHDACWNVALALSCGFDLDEDTVFNLLATEYNPRCSPAWSEKELTHKARQAANAKSERGYLLGDSKDWSPVVTRAIPPMPKPMREPGDDTEEIDSEPERQYEPPEADVTESAVTVKPIHERFALYTERDLIKQVFDHVTSDAPKRGYTTGVKEIDDAISGLRPGMITCFGAQTSFGKSTAATMVLESNLPLGVKVLLISNEDQPLMYGRRVVCRRGNLNALAVRDAKLSPEQKARIGDMGNAASNDYVLLNAAGMSAESIADCIIGCREEIGTQLVVIDYLQRIRMKMAMQDRRNEVSRAAELISDAIKRHGPDMILKQPAAGLVFSQLKRLQDKEPDLESMKESGDVENMAEHIILGWRKIIQGVARGEENVQRMYNIPKNKDGIVDFMWQELEFDQRTASFTGHIVGAPRPESVKQFDDFGDGMPPY